MHGPENFCVLEDTGVTIKHIISGSKEKWRAKLWPKYSSRCTLIEIPKQSSWLDSMAGTLQVLGGSGENAYLEICQNCK